MLNTPSAGSIFGGGCSVTDLWTANTDVLSSAYPGSTPDKPYDASSADMALCMHLAFWTGRDCERMVRLFERSALVRGKWFEREDYRTSTVLQACGLTQNVYRNPRATPPGALEALPGPEAGTTPSTGAVRGGYQYMTIDAQVELFKNCTYVTDVHKILTPSGLMLKPEQFRARYGGYEYALDAEGRRSTHNAWAAFTENQGYDFPKVDTSCFRPCEPPFSIIESGNRRAVNTYVPIETPCKPGDAGPFLDYMRRLIPDERDRTILLSYMAACVQHIGVKFQWCPVVQGCEGNGKTLITRAVAAAIGQQYTHIKDATDLGNVFNAWTVGKLFIGIEEIYTPDKPHLLESLKPLITNDVIEQQSKGVDQRNADNYANLIMNTNHRDGVRANRDQRRYAIIYTAQQQAGDLIRDGMGGDYFPRLYKWLKADGFAIITHYLKSYAIPAEFNPATDCHRAPQTSSSEEAILEGLGALELEILEAIAECRPGFCGGWVSSMAVQRLFQDSRRRPPARKHLKGMLSAIGYVPHPALPDGRSSQFVTIDGGRPKLYIKEGHINGQLRGVAIVDGYTKAQQTVITETQSTSEHPQLPQVR